MDELLTVKEVAAKLKVSRPTIYTFIGLGLKYIKLGERADSFSVPYAPAARARLTAVMPLSASWRFMLSLDSFDSFMLASPSRSQRAQKLIEPLVRTPVTGKEFLDILIAV